MEKKRYKITEGDTLKSISEKQNISIEELINFHNSCSTFTQSITSDYLPLHLEYIFVEIKPIKINQVSSIHLDAEESAQVARYRCEQTVVMKLSGIIHSHADTKREFEVKKYRKDGVQYVKIKMIENIVEAYQKQLELAIKTVSEIDMIKCDVTVSLKGNGKIGEIVNFEQIRKKWNQKKKILERDFSFMRDKKAHKDILDFLELNDQQFSSQQNIINDLNTKLFFDVFFDKYLTDDDYLDGYSKTYHSQLFDGYGVNLNFTQDILAEDPDRVELRKVSKIDKSRIDNVFLNEQYEAKFRPIVKYQFSEYNFSVREHCTINTTDRWIDKSDITIIEEVKNNVQVLIDYKLRKIE